MNLPAPIIAAIDVGTNSFHLIIASVNNRGMLMIHQREKETVRLGASTGKDMKYLAPDAIERGVNTLSQFAKLARSAKAEIYAVATSAVREANNRYDFIEQVKKEAGIDISVVSGAEEGRLIYMGAVHALPIFSKKALLLDIGGGSTETIIGENGDIKFIHSAKIGSVRITQNFFTDYISSRSKIKQCREYIKGLWAPTLNYLYKDKFDTVIGTSGTIQNIVTIAHSLKGERIPDITNGLTADKKDIINAISTIINTKTIEERMLIPGMDPKRADIILGGALILERAVMALDIKQILISSYALREGIVFDIVNKKQLNITEPYLSHLRYETILNLCSHYKVNITHSESVKDIALSIYDDLRSIHKLGNEEKELLEAAAMLHDVGYYISHDQHHKHSYYLISQSIMQGFNNDESEIIANIARYHRKSLPKKKHENFMYISQEKQYIIKVLSGILRIAEGIDRRQMQIVKSARVKLTDKSAQIYLFPDPQKITPDIELWGAERRKDLLEETLGISITFHIEEY